MKGPSDISDILSGLKTKTINIRDKLQQSSGQSEYMSNIGYTNPNNAGEPNNESSTISINDLKKLQGNGTLPKKSKRRPKSATTTNLDI